MAGAGGPELLVFEELDISGAFGLVGILPFWPHLYRKFYGVLRVGLEPQYPKLPAPQYLHLDIDFISFEDIQHAQRIAGTGENISKTLWVLLDVVRQPIACSAAKVNKMRVFSV